jgi:hypothetical protein
MRDKLRLPFTQVGEGLLNFDLPEGDVGVHPTDESTQGGAHDVSFYCDDIEGTVADLRSRGVNFDGEVADHGYGFVTYFTMPGDVRVQLYEPKYQKATSKPKARAAAKRKPTKPVRRAATRRPMKPMKKTSAPAKKAKAKARKR